MVETEKEQLRRRAYELWESAGRPAIDPLSFWSLAVQEQRLKSAQAAASRERKPATQG